MALLLQKMKRDRSRVGMNVVVEKYELIALEKKIAVAYHKHDYKQAKNLVAELQAQLDMSVIKNQQYIYAEQIRIEMREGKYSWQKGIEKLYGVLHMTLAGSDEKIFSDNLTSGEADILNQIAILFCQNNQKEKGIMLWKKMLENYQNKGVNPVFNIRGYEVIVGNIAGRMEELNYVEEPIQLCMKRLEIALEIGKGNGIGRSLAIIACVLERQHDKRCVERFRQTLNIYKLMKFDYRYQCIKEYIEEKGIYIKSA